MKEEGRVGLARSRENGAGRNEEVGGSEDFQVVIDHPKGRRWGDARRA